MIKQPINVLVIDDDPVIRNLMRTILAERVNAFVVEAPSKAIKLIQKQPIDIVISDYKLPEMNGLKLLEIIKQEDPRVEMIMISSDAGTETVIQAMRMGVADFFKKPFTAQDIWLSIERTQKFADIKTALHKETDKHQYLKAQLNNELGKTIIGKSGLIQSVREQIELVAQTPDTSVLIIGDSGSGKELVARGIHENSGRKNDFFGAVNMSAIPESLFESEFFGHKKGSFTGALADKAGWFESANGGTLFFDEVGEMSMALQVKLLRVLEDKTFTKIGTQREQKFDIRIISATNKPLDVLTDGKSFRLDLFHRLGAFIIHLPPLKDRKEDIPVLANHFLTSLGEKLGKKDLIISQEALDYIAEYDFPGNIRELRNLTERAIILCKDGLIKPEHFGYIPKNKTKNQTEEELFDLQKLEKRTILKALEKTNYNKSDAAKLLNIEWNALYRRMQKYSIAIPAD